jgi:hypothetical protein
VAFRIAQSEARTRQALHRLQEARHAEPLYPFSFVVEAQIADAEFRIELALESIRDARARYSERLAAAVEATP